MKLNQNFQDFFSTARTTFKNTLAECLLVAFAVVIGCLSQKVPSIRLEQISLFPIYFLILNIVNYQTLNKKTRGLYYALGVVFVGLLFLKFELNPIFYVVGLSATILAFFSHKWLKNNTEFAENTVRNILTAAIAAIVTLLFFLLVLAIEFSLIYMFNIEQVNVFFYTAMIAWVGIFPLLFLIFNNEKLVFDFKNRFLNAVFNYLFTPAMIIYALILYLYFIKILIVCELPKGNIAYMVFGFVIWAYLLKLIYPLFQKSYYRFIYKYLPYFILPALVVFWIGSLFRIHEYGLTESRVYLLLGGVFITISSFLLLHQKTGKFLYLSIGLIIMLSVFTYIPKISAVDIGIYSQENRFKNALKELNISHIGSTTVLPNYEKTPENIRLLSQLYESFCYVRNATLNKGDNEYMRKKYGICTPFTLQTIMGESNYAAIHETEIDLEDPNHYFTLNNCKIDNYNEYSAIYYLKNNNQDKISYKINWDDRILKIWINKKIILEENMDTILLHQLKKINITSEKIALFNANSFENEEQELAFFTYEISSGKIIFSHINYQLTSDLKVDNITPLLYLEK